MRSTTALLFTDAVSMSLMILFSIALARTLGEELFGLFSILSVFAMVIRSIAEAGFEIQIPRIIAAEKSEQISIIKNAQIFKNTIWLYTLPVGIVVGIVQHEILLVGILMIFNLSFIQFSTYKSYLRGIGRMDIIARVETGFNVIQYIMLFSILFTYESLYLMFIVITVIGFMKVFYMNKVIRTNFLNIQPASNLLFRFNKRLDRSELTSQFQLLGVTFFSVLHYRSPMLVLWGIASVGQLGVYSAAQRFMTMLRVIPGAIINSLVPEASRLRSRNSDNRFISVYSTVLFVGLIISGTLYFTSDFLMELTFEFEGASNVLGILSVSFVFVMLNSTTEAYLLAWKQEKIVNLILLTSAIFAIVLSIILFYRNGIEGIAASVVITEIFMLLMNVTALNKFKNQPSTMVE